MKLAGIQMLKHYFVEQKKSFNWGKSPSTSRAIEQKILRLPYFSLAYMCGNTKIYPFFTITSGIHKNFIFQGYTLKLLIYKHATTTLTTSDVVEYKRKKGTRRNFFTLLWELPKCMLLQLYLPVYRTRIKICMEKFKIIHSVQMDDLSNNCW